MTIKAEMCRIKGGSSRRTIDYYVDCEMVKSSFDARKRDRFDEFEGRRLLGVSADSSADEQHKGNPFHGRQRYLPP